jgi:hypothetical protein
MPVDYNGLLLGLVPLVAGIGITANAVTTMQDSSAKGREAAAWPEAKGRVTRSWIETGSTAGNRGRRYPIYTPRVAYSYQVGGSLYLNDRLSLSQARQQVSRDAAEAELRDFPIGAPVMVRYDPRSPGRSALIVEDGGSVPYIGLGVGGLLLIFGGYVLVMTLRPRRPSAPRPENQAADSPDENSPSSFERYRPVYVSQSPRFSLDRDVKTGAPVLSIPVSNQMVEYEEWYSISEDEFEQFMADHELAKAFALRCGRRELDERLVLKPGRDRGYYSG